MRPKSLRRLDQFRYYAHIGSDHLPPERLPFAENQLDLIYSEHVLEHVSFSTGISFLKEARRVLRPQGILRIAMPDLDDLVENYQKDWRCPDWVRWPQFSFIQTRAEMINIAFRWWVIDTFITGRSWNVR